MPKDRITQSHQGYGFVEFLGEEDADYSIKIMNMIKLYGKPIRVNKVGPVVRTVWPHLHRVHLAQGIHEANYGSDFVCRTTTDLHGNLRANRLTYPVATGVP